MPRTVNVVSHAQIKVEIW